MIDSHCHLDFDIFDNSRASLIEAMLIAGIDRCIIPGVRCQSWSKLTGVVNSHSCCHAALGLHPYFITEHKEDHLNRLAQLLDENIVAVGEIGLDSTLMAQYGAQQQHYFERQLALATENKLPVIIHARGCFDQVTATLRRCHFEQGGIIHAFTGSLQQGHKLAELGFKLGVGGAVTHPRAKKLRRTVASLEASCIVLETDSPDMKPAFLHQSTPNTPLLLPLIAAVVATLRGESVESLSRISDANILSALPRLNREKR